LHPDRCVTWPQRNTRNSSGPPQKHAVRPELRAFVRYNVRPRGARVQEASLKNRWLAVAVLGVCWMVAPLRAQDGPEKGGHDFQVWTGGGTSTNGGVRDIGVWNAGFRYGWILTEAHGPSILRGRFEYAVDTAPVFWFFQPGGTAFGAGVSPVVLKWNFEGSSRLVPYIEANAGFVVSSRDVPPGAWRGNFISSGAIGTHLLGSRGYLNAEVRLMHISNAGLTNYNPGINTIQVRIGLGRFLRSE